MSAKRKDAPAIPAAPRLFPHAQIRVPVQLRQRAVDKVYDEYVRILKASPSSPELYVRAAAETMKLDQAMIKQYNERNSYQGAFAARLSALRRATEPLPELFASSPPSSPPKREYVVIDDADDLPSDNKRIRTIPSSSSSSSTVPSRSSPSKALMSADPRSLEHLVMSELELWQQNFPMTEESPLPFNEDNKAEKTCVRCGRLFIARELLADDPLATDCLYHPKKLGPPDTSNGFPMPRSQVHRCCSASRGQPGCTFGPHVHETPTDFPHAIISSRPRLAHSPGRAAVALDCEMIYTVRGRELARLSVVDEHGDPLIDRFVRPVGTVLDYNTLHSGVTREDLLRSGVLEFDEARDLLLCIVDAETIVVGHGLENDFAVMGLVHKKVVDTSVLFERRGKLKTYKVGLAQLMEEMLEEGLDRSRGHDSN